MKKHNPIANLKNFAHPPKAQTRADTPKIIGPSGDHGKKSKQPGFTKGGKKVMK